MQVRFSAHIQRGSCWRSQKATDEASKQAESAWLDDIVNDPTVQAIAESTSPDIFVSLQRREEPDKDGNYWNQFVFRIENRDPETLPADLRNISPACTGAAASSWSW